MPTYAAAATIELPTALPLPHNPFADDTFLTRTRAREAVYLACLIYRISIQKQQGAENPFLLLNNVYDVHYYEDTGSTEVMVVSRNATTFNNSTSTETASNNQLFIVFQGTDSSLDGDWITNLNTRKTWYGPEEATIRATVDVQSFSGQWRKRQMRVHSGFNGVFSDDLYSKVMTVVEPLLDLRNDEDGNYTFDKEINFVGHSLGGANCHLFGTYFAYFHPEVSTYITSVAAPRQGKFDMFIL